LAKKDNELAVRAKEAAPSKRITMSDLRAEEWKRIVVGFQKTPVPPN